MKRIALFLSLFSVTAVVASPNDLSPQKIARINADVEAVLNRTGTLGATVAVAEQGRIVYTNAYGLRDRERHLPTTVDTYFEIGSITKEFTSAAILQLQEAGKLHIDDKLAKYLPDAPHAEEVTLRQLLSHTSGLADYLDGPDIEDAATKSATFEQLMARIAKKPLDFAPGSHFSYSSTGYILLGRVIEVVSHESYQHYVQSHLLDVAGMAHTFTIADEKGLSNMAVGYWWKEGKITPSATISSSFGWSAGFLVSTVSDLQKWNDALQSGKIVSPADYVLMSTPVSTTQQGDADYGLGLADDSIDEQSYVGHDGGSFGFTTASEYFLKQKVRIIAFTNNGYSPTRPDAAMAVMTAIFEDLYPEIAAAAARPAAGESPAITRSVKGAFAAVQAGSDSSPYVSAAVNEKLKGGAAKELSSQFAPFGQPTAFIFKGEKSVNGKERLLYLIHFGPGVVLQFLPHMESDGKVGGWMFE
jgi:D-alanyl-D-alanine carboxypeptidase